MEKINRAWDMIWKKHSPWCTRVSPSYFWDLPCEHLGLITSSQPHWLFLRYLGHWKQLKLIRITVWLLIFHEIIVSKCIKAMFHLKKSPCFSCQPFLNHFCWFNPLILLLMILSVINLFSMCFHLIIYHYVIVIVVLVV